MGEQTILEGIGIGAAMTRDHQNRATCLRDFADRWSRPLWKARLRQRPFETAHWRHRNCSPPDKWAAEGMSEGAISTPRSRCVLRNWWKNAPRQSRLPMSQLYMWALAGFLQHCSCNVLCGAVRHLCPTHGPATDVCKRCCRSC